MQYVRIAVVGAAVLTACVLHSPAEGRPGDEPGRTDVVGGTRTHYTRWRGVVGVFMDGGGRCTGVLIDPSVILTAAHCVEQFESEPGRVRIGAGPDLGDEDGLRIVSEVAEVRVLPPLRDDDAIFMRDLALLRLSAQVVDAPYYAIDQEAKPRRDTVLTLVGYGMTGYERQDDGSPREGLVTVVDPFPAARESLFTVFFRGPAMVCSGDSGGPLFVQRNGSLMVTAIASAMEYCNPEYLGYATHTGAYRDWLASVYQEWTGNPLPTRGNEALAETATNGPTPPSATVTPSPPRNLLYLPVNDQPTFPPVGAE